MHARVYTGMHMAARATHVPAVSTVYACARAFAGGGARPSHGIHRCVLGGLRSPRACGTQSDGESTPPLLAPVAVACVLRLTKHTEWRRGRPETVGAVIEAPVPGVG